MMDVVVVHPGAGEHPDGASERLGNVAGVLERFPTDLEEVTVLRVEDGGVARAEPEESGIEEFDPLERRPRPDVVRVAEQLWVFASRNQLLVGIAAHRLDAAAQIAPELPDIARARDTRSHPDNGDAGRIDGPGSGH